MAESKYDEAKAEEGKGDEKTSSDIFDQVSKFCMSSGFEKDFEDFAAKHSKIFEVACEMKPGDEHNLQFHEVYREYLDVFEGNIQRFVQENGSSVDEFQRLAQSALKDEAEFSERRFFIEALLATTEYETFLGLMKNEVRRLKSMPK